MFPFLEDVKKRVLAKESLKKEDAVGLFSLSDSSPAALDALTFAADEIRRRFVGQRVDLCCILNAKSGRCSENCRYCAQSAIFRTVISEYPFQNVEKIIEAGRRAAESGIGRFSVVTSGRKLGGEEIAMLGQAFETLSRDGISLCASLGFLTLDELRFLKEMGMTRYHHNLETSRRFFPQICSTHSYDEKLKTIDRVQSVGLEICSGGIIGLGETKEDRIDMAFELARLGVKSVPVNVLNPIPGTPLEKNPVLSSAEVRQTLAIYRFILPDASIRLAGGRGLFADEGESFFMAGADAAITGDMLTTAGISVVRDRALFQKIGRLAEEPLFHHHEERES